MKITDKGGKREGKHQLEIPKNTPYYTKCEKHCWKMS